MIPASLVKPLLYLAILALVIAAALFAKTYFENVGSLTEREAVSRANQEAGHAAETSRSRFDDCNARGLRFDYATSQCSGTPSDRGN